MDLLPKENYFLEYFLRVYLHYFVQSMLPNIYNQTNRQEI